MSRAEYLLDTHHTYLDRSGREKVHRVGGITVTNEQLVRNGEARAQEASDPVELLFCEGSENRDFGNQLSGLQTQIKGRPHLDPSAGKGDVPAQRGIEFGADDSVVEQHPVFQFFTSQPDFVQDTALEEMGVIWILLTKRIERGSSHVASLVNNFQESLRSLVTN